MGGRGGDGRFGPTCRGGTLPKCTPGITCVFGLLRRLGEVAMDGERGEVASAVVRGGRWGGAVITVRHSPLAPSAASRSASSCKPRGLRNRTVVGEPVTVPELELGPWGAPMRWRMVWELRMESAELGTCPPDSGRLTRRVRRAEGRSRPAHPTPQTSPRSPTMATTPNGNGAQPSRQHRRVREHAKRACLQGLRHLPASSILDLVAMSEAVLRLRHLAPHYPDGHSWSTRLLGC